MSERTEQVGVHADLGWALATTLRAYARAADQAVAELPGGSRGYRLLSAVVRDCPRSQLALAQHIGLDRTVVTYLLDDLVGAGLVERQPDPADRRARRVVATPAGLARLAQLDTCLGAVEDDVLAPLAAAERGQLRSLLQRVAIGLGPGEDVGEQADAGPCGVAAALVDCAGELAPLGVTG